MSTFSIEQFLKDFTRDELSPTPKQREYVSEKYEQLSRFLEGSNFMAGSYARHTSVRPPKDLDVIWIPIDNLSKDTAAAMLVKLATHLRAAYQSSGEAVSVHVQTHSVTIEFSDALFSFAIDVVPAIATDSKNEFGGTIYLVPEIQKLRRTERKSIGERYSWIKSDPSGYTSEAIQLDEHSAGVFRKSTKIIKSWRQQCLVANPDTFKLKSFHCEQLIARTVRKNMNLTIVEVVDTFFQTLDMAIVTPAIKDRADHDVYIDAYISEFSSVETALIIRLGLEAQQAWSKLKKAQSESEANSAIKLVIQGGAAQAFAAPRIHVKEPPQPHFCWKD